MSELWERREFRMADEKSSCCCGGEEEECCCGGGCCTDEACKDEPFIGRKQVVYVDYLYLDQSVCDRCQGTDVRVELAVDLLAPIMEMAGYALVMSRIEIANEKLAEQHRFESSPTVRVNGVDICPEVIENPCDCCRDISDYDVYCRQFDFNGKLYEVPPTAYVVKRICEIVFNGEQPSDEPYEMPENIKGFLEGRAAKQASGKSEKPEGSCCCS